MGPTDHQKQKSGGGNSVQIDSLYLCSSSSLVEPHFAAVLSPLHSLNCDRNTIAITMVIVYHHETNALLDLLWRYRGRLNLSSRVGLHLNQSLVSVGTAEAGESGCTGWAKIPRGVDGAVPGITETMRKKMINYLTVLNSFP